MTASKYVTYCESCLKPLQPREHRFCAEHRPAKYKQLPKARRKPGDWWNRSWSIVSGCTPAGAGCDRCWARSLVARFPVAHGGEGVPFHQVVLHHDRLDEPLRRRTPAVYATSLLGDLFHAEVPRGFLVEAFNVMLDARAQKHQFVLLTKRPHLAAQFLASPPILATNVIVMASVWDQASADNACEALSQLHGVRWGLHCEPLIGAIDLTKTPLFHADAEAKCSKHHIQDCSWCQRLSCCDNTTARHAGLSWIVVGAENGPGARPFQLDWAQQIQAQCKAAGVPYWFKGANKQEAPADMIVRRTPWGMV